MTTQLWAEEKQVRAFEEHLEHAALPASVVSAQLNDAKTLLEVTVGVPDVGDWRLRHSVLAVANEVEAHANLTILCFFRAR
jgi:hypothetical protein